MLLNYFVRQICRLIRTTLALLSHLPSAAVKGDLSRILSHEVGPALRRARWRRPGEPLLPALTARIALLSTDIVIIARRIQR